MRAAVAFLSSARGRGLFHVLSAAGVLTALNAVKPLHMDDPYYCYLAKHVAEAPLDPLGFRITWDDANPPTRSAVHALAPPVFVYWLAAGVRLFPDSPVLWKLWASPFAFLFAGSFFALARRFARPLEAPLTWAAVLSPAVLPSLNLMVDVPASALVLAALVLFLRACDRDSAALALAAGLVAGLAAETKYSGFVAPLAFAGYGLATGRWRLAAAAATLAVAIFLAWEGLVVWRYGESNFIYNAAQRGSTPVQRWLHLALPLVALSAVAPAWLLLALVGLRAPRGVVVAAAALAALGLGVVALLPDGYAAIVRDSDGRVRLKVYNLVFDVLGGAVVTTTAAAALRLCRRGGAWRLGAAERFLLVWLAAEVAGYFLLSPFPAVRRVLGVFAASGVLLGRLAARRRRDPATVAAVWRVAAAGVAFGLAFYSFDAREARANLRAADRAARRVGEAPPGAATWFVGRWAFRWYAEGHGMRTALDAGTVFRAGDRVVVQETPVAPWPLKFPDGALEPVARVEERDRLAVRTLGAFYAGRTPLETRTGPRASATIYRVVRDCTASLPPRP